MPAVSDLTFVNNFWDSEERGVSVVENKFKSSKQTFEELSHFYKERVALEEEYGRRLMSMTRRSAVGGGETNNTGLFFESLRLETEQMARAHSTQASAICNEVQKPLENFISSFKARKRTIESTILKVIKYKKAIFAKMEMSRSKYESECLRFRAMSADKFLVDGNELRKLNAKLERTEESIKIQRTEYYEYYKEAVEIHERFIREWKSALSQYQELEEERIKFLRSNIWTYCNLVSISCVNIDTSSENIRMALEKCEARSEVEKFVDKYGTGRDIPGIPKFFDYIKPEVSNEADLEPSVRANFNRGQQSLPTAESSTTVKISKKPPPQEISEQSNALLMLGKRSDETRQTFAQRARDEDDDENDVAHGASIVKTVNTRLDPPVSDYSDTTSNRHSHKTSSNYNQTSQYSEPTDLSVHNQATMEGKKHWNSPQRRRRSRGSMHALSDYSSSNNEPQQSVSSGKRKSFILPLDDDTAVQSDDILRSTLRDLQAGGNGDMNALKKSVRPKSMVFDSTRPRVQETRRSRPRSMLLDEQLTVSLEQGQKKMPVTHAATHATTHAATHKAAPDALPTRGPLTGRPVLRHCRAIYSYTAKEEDECSFKKKDIILVLDDGDLWWSVEVLGKQEIGQAPSNYLAPI